MYVPVIPFTSPPACPSLMPFTPKAAAEKICEYSFAVPSPLDASRGDRIPSEGGAAMLELRGSSDSGALGRSSGFFVVVRVFRRENSDWLHR